MNTYIKILNKILAIWIQPYIKIIVPYDAVWFIPGMQKFFSNCKSIRLMQLIKNLKN